MTYFFDTLAGIGAGCVVCSVWLFWILWRSSRPSKTTRLGSSSHPGTIGRTPSLVANPARPGDSPTPPPVMSPTGQHRARLGRDKKGNLVVVRDDPA